MATLPRKRIFPHRANLRINPSPYLQKKLPKLPLRDTSPRRNQLRPPPAEPEPVSQPKTAEPSPSPVSDGGEPFSGGTSFDPNAGLIVDQGGEVPQRKSTGLIAVVAAASLLIGGLAGNLLATRSSKTKMIDAGKAKGAEMLQEIERVKETRSRISLGLTDVKKTLQTDPVKGADMLSKLATENLTDYPKIDKLFGWQFASMGKQGIKRAFNLYEHANGLALDTGTLAAFVKDNAKVLGPAIQGPALFGVATKKSGAVLVEVVQPICNMGEKKPCPQGKAGSAEGYEIREALGGPTAVVLERRSSAPSSRRADLQVRDR